MTLGLLSAGVLWTRLRRGFGAVHLCWMIGRCVDRGQNAGGCERHCGERSELQAGCSKDSLHLEHGRHGSTGCEYVACVARAQRLWLCQ